MAACRLLVAAYRLLVAAGLLVARIMGFFCAYDFRHNGEIEYSWSVGFGELQSTFQEWRIFRVMNARYDDTRSEDSATTYTTYSQSYQNAQHTGHRET